MLIGAHAVLYSADAAADRAFLRDVLRLSGVDAGEGWLIFGLPPAEIAVHPAEGEAGEHELFFMCADVEAFRDAMRAVGIACAAVEDQRWGRLTHLPLPGGGRIGVYEPRHVRPHAQPGAVKRTAAKRPKRAGRAASQPATRARRASARKASRRATRRGGRARRR